MQSGLIQIQSQPNIGEVKSSEGGNVLQAQTNPEITKDAILFQQLLSQNLNPENLEKGQQGQQGQQAPEEKVQMLHKGLSNPLATETNGVAKELTPDVDIESLTNVIKTEDDKLIDPKDLLDKTKDSKRSGLFLSEKKLLDRFRSSSPALPHLIKPTGTEKGTNPVKSQKAPAMTVANNQANLESIIQNHESEKAESAFTSKINEATPKNDLLNIIKKDRVSSYDKLMETPEAKQTQSFKMTQLNNILNLANPYSEVTSEIKGTQGAQDP